MISAQGITERAQKTTAFAGYILSMSQPHLHCCAKTRRCSSCWQPCCALCSQERRVAVPSYLQHIVEQDYPLYEPEGWLTVFYCEACIGKTTATARSTESMSGTSKTNTSAAPSATSVSSACPPTPTPLSKRVDSAAKQPGSTALRASSSTMSSTVSTDGPGNESESYPICLCERGEFVGMCCKQCGLPPF